MDGDSRDSADAKALAAFMNPGICGIMRRRILQCSLAGDGAQRLWTFDVSVKTKNHLPHCTGRRFVPLYHFHSPQNAASYARFVRPTGWFRDPPSSSGLYSFARYDTLASTGHFLISHAANYLFPSSPVI